MARSQEKRDSILKAAAAEFKEFGFQAANMDRIAARAPASKRTIYKHFASKQALFEEIGLLLAGQTAQAGERPFRADEDPRDALQQIGRSLLDLYLDPEFLDTARMLFPEYFRSPDLARAAWAKASSSEDGLTRWIRSAASQGHLSIPNPTLAADQFTSLLKGLSFWRYLLVAEEHLPSEAVRKEMVSETVAMFFARYGRG